jgi:hypothetical protein
MRGQIFNLAFYALLVGFFVLSFELTLAEETTEMLTRTEDSSVKESLDHSIFMVPSPPPLSCPGNEVLIRGRCRDVKNG